MIMLGDEGNKINWTMQLMKGGVTFLVIRAGVLIIYLLERFKKWKEKDMFAPEMMEMVRVWVEMN